LDTTESLGEGEYSSRYVSERLKQDEIHVHRCERQGNSTGDLGQREKSLKSIIIERAISAGSGHGKTDRRATQQKSQNPEKRNYL
jgi:hypothetical protein